MGLSPGQELSQVMGRTSKDMAMKSPILLASWKNKNSFEKHRMVRRSLKKLRKIGDPEKLLHRAVLINNTLDCMRNGGTNENTGPACRKESSINTYAASNYSTEEDHILNSIQLPPHITPISDDIIKQDNSEAEKEMKDNRGDSVMEHLLNAIPKNTSVTFYRKSDKNSYSGMIHSNENQS